jgi:hypothetical protein
MQEKVLLVLQSRFANSIRTFSAHDVAPATCGSCLRRTGNGRTLAIRIILERVFVRMKLGYRENKGGECNLARGHADFYPLDENHFDGVTGRCDGISKLEFYYHLGPTAARNARFPTDADRADFLLIPPRRVFSRVSDTRARLSVDRPV